MPRKERQKSHQMRRANWITILNQGTVVPYLVAHIADLGKGYLARCDLNYVHGMVVEADQVTQHPRGLVEGAVTVV
ncbi:hypothetical protein BC937DRAFT_86718 [Endogone sp. FLAS-F59071]|nr:hypothetical protein BC937DRAFT_86718 [Endogone sp. FLAS-F59071]|eukprot:RUS19909.1 hypothetical protein BC937DRAFT_86718 [Endogone sp. FLAS-F59071]